MIQQFNKSPTQLSILAILLSSEVYHEDLLKVLKETRIPTNILDSSFKGMVSLVLATNQVSFSNDELPLEGKGHTLAMHIIVKCEDMIFVRVLIDNGSALNVYSMAILESLNMDMSLVKPTTMIIRAFERVKKCKARLS